MGDKEFNSVQGPQNMQNVLFFSWSLISCHTIKLPAVVKMLMYRHADLLDHAEQHGMQQEKKTFMSYHIMRLSHHFLSSIL